MGWLFGMELEPKLACLGLWVRAAYLVELGREDEALAALEQSYEERESGLAFSILGDSAFDPLHYDPRFQDLLRRMNLPQ